MNADHELRGEARWGDLDRLLTSSGMYDAVIEEIAGRRIRIGTSGSRTSRPATTSASTSTRRSWTASPSRCAGGEPTRAGPGCSATRASTSTSRTS